MMMISRDVLSIGPNHDVIETIMMRKVRQILNQPGIRNAIAYFIIFFITLYSHMLLQMRQRHSRGEWG